MKKAYNNSAFDTNDCTNTQTTSMELEGVVIAGKTVAKCCGSSNAQNDRSSENNSSKTSGPNVALNACLPKCPAVRSSPWDPVKTRFAAVLTISIVVWLLLGVFVIKL